MSDMYNKICLRVLYIILTNSKRLSVYDKFKHIITNLFLYNTF